MHDTAYCPFLFACGWPGSTCTEPRARELHRLPEQGAPQHRAMSYEWRCATMDAAFEPRDGAGLLSFRGKLWLLGGATPVHKF